MKRFLAVILVFGILIGGGFIFVKSGGMESLLLQKQKVEEGTKWVYASYTFDYENTEGGPLAMASSIAKDAGNSHVTEIANKEAIFDETVRPVSFTYYDYIVCKDGKLTLHEYTRELEDIPVDLKGNTVKYYTKVSESERVIGTYDGKKITLDNTDYDTYLKAYVSKDVLYIVLDPLTNLDMTVTLKFNLEQAK